MAVHYFDPDPAIIAPFLAQKYKVPGVDVLGWLEQIKADTPLGKKPSPTEFAHGEWVFEIRMGENGWEVETLHKPTLLDGLTRQADQIKP